MSDKILLVEDDHLQAGGILPHLTGYGDVRVISTEYGFRSAADDLAKSRQLPLRLAVIDPMLRWANPSKEMPEPPPEVREGGYFRAGVRCRQYLRDIERQTDTAQTPVIFLSSLDPERVDRMVGMLSRTGGTEGNPDPRDYQCVLKARGLTELDEAVRRVLQP